MQSAPLPPNEALRLAAIDSFDLLHSPAEERFDRITRIAAHATHSPIALISFVGKSFQWFKSRVGFALDQTAREVSFCAHAILQEKPFVVQDALLDERFLDNPMVTGSPFIRFYAGIPIRLADGVLAGTLCVIDTVPRGLSDNELGILIDLGSLVESELQHERALVSNQPESFLMSHARRSNLLDPITGSWNRAGFEALLQVEVEHARNMDTSFALILLMLDDFDIMLECEGETTGAQLLVEAASRMRRVLRGGGIVTRMGADAFALLVAPCEKLALSRIQRRVRSAIECRPFLIESDKLVTMTASTGAALVSRPGFDVALALVEADRRLNIARLARAG